MLRIVTGSQVRVAGCLNKPTRSGGPGREREQTEKQLARQNAVEIALPVPPFDLAWDGNREARNVPKQQESHNSS